MTYFPGTKAILSTNANTNVPNVKNGIMYHRHVRSDPYDEIRYVERFNFLIFKTWDKQRRRVRKHYEWDYTLAKPDEKINYKEWIEVEQDWYDDHVGPEKFTFGWWASPDNVEQWDFDPPAISIGGTLQIGKDQINPSLHKEEGTMKPDGDASEKLKLEDQRYKASLSKFGKTSGTVSKEDSVKEVVSSSKRYFVNQEVTKEMIDEMKTKGVLIQGNTAQAFRDGKKCYIKDIVVLDKVTHSHDLQGMPITYAEYLFILGFFDEAEGSKQ